MMALFLRLNIRSCNTVMTDLEVRALLEQHHRESYGWALACCDRDPERAENVLQSTYMEVLDRRAVFDGRAAFKTWLFAVIRNHARREWRRSFWQLRRAASWEEGLAVAGRETAADEVVYLGEMRELLQRALARMPRRQREVLQLVFYHDLSLAETAQVLGIGLGSGRRHYDRGKKKLRRFLEEATAHHAVGREENFAAIPDREIPG